MKKFILKYVLLLILCTSTCCAQSFTQRSLKPDKADIAFIFIGGLGDETTGIVYRLYQHCPQLSPERKESRGYYHWDGDDITQPWPYIKGILSDVQAFQQQNPQASIVLVGHSLGAVTALELCTSLSNTYLITLDPVDRQSSRKRPQGVQWWGHAYVTHSSSARDIIFQLAGRWGDCPHANVSINCDGRIKNELNRYFIHDYAYDMFLSRTVKQKALFEYLQEQLP